MNAAPRRNEDVYLPVRSKNKLWLLFDAYCREVDASFLAESSKTDYKMFAEQFMRWIEGEFTPGGTLR